MRPHLINNLRMLSARIDRSLLYAAEDLPLAVEIETNTQCTRSCFYCLKRRNNEGILETDLFYSVIDQLQQWGFRGRLFPHSFNEPLTDERMLQFLSYASRKLPQCEIILHTNGDLLTLEGIRSFIANGASQISVSLHDPVSTGLEGKIKNFCRQFRCVTTVDMRDHKRDVPLFNRGGSIALKGVQSLKRCYLVDIMVIKADGNVVLCCQDSMGQYTFGNAGNQPIRNIWEMEDFKMIRKEVRNGKFKLPICRQCGYIF
ncbi:MAG: SPASM domain-containing protein [Nitrospirota bacterium]|nr:SPASM domain-containing protein [Nitrospirota bacterium]